MNVITNNDKYIDTSGTTIKTRFKLPDGFERIPLDENSFGHYLRNFKLKKHGSKVKYFNGDEKANFSAYCAVLDISVGEKDLQQCADACMRLRAEYLFAQKRYSDISFTLTNGFVMAYSEFRKGKRLKVDGNKTYWIQTTKISDTYDAFMSYMTTIFTYAGTLSLSKQLKSTEKTNAQIGNLFLKGGSPGHAVIIVDMAKHKETGEIIFLLAQSYMPAQNIQVLNNISEKGYGPWYSLNFEGDLNTPEWTFDGDKVNVWE